MIEQSKDRLGRREFLVAAATAGFMIVEPQLVRGTAANSQVRFGILGCGDRGTAVGTGFVQNAGARVTAIGDLFGDQLEAGSKGRATPPLTPRNSSRDPTLIRKSSPRKKSISSSSPRRPTSTRTIWKRSSRPASTFIARSLWPSMFRAPITPSRSVRRQKAS